MDPLLIRLEALQFFLTVQCLQEGIDFDQIIAILNKINSMANENFL